MRTKIIVVLSVAILAFAMVAGMTAPKIQRKPTGDSTRLTPVVVELFTSEGCSSCPPADVVLQKLVREQPIPGVEIIPLEEHVDYWDHNGWRDPFSNGKFSNRQSEYSEVINDHDTYTPEAVIQGRYGFIGSEEDTALHAIARQAEFTRNATTKVEISITKQADGYTVQVSPSAGNRPYRVVIAETQDGLSNMVTAGENLGRHLTHVATVVDLQSYDQHDGSSVLTQNWQPKKLAPHTYLVVFVSDLRTKAIITAKQIAIT